MTGNTNGSLAGALSERSGQDLNACYQCQKCTAGCPVARWMDISPSALIRMIQTGEKREILESRAIWLCVACGTCGTRCPNGIDIGGLMDTLREVAIEEGVPSSERNILILHEAFVRNLRRDGRLHEVSMLVDYKLRSRDLFTDVASGAVMFLRGKIPIKPDRVKGRAAIREIFKRCGR